MCVLLIKGDKDGHNSQKRLRVRVCVRRHAYSVIYVLGDTQC